MIENLRVHDHFTTDQGAKLGVLNAKIDNAAGQTVTTNTETVVTGSGMSVTIPTGTPGGRYVLVFTTLGIAVASGLVNIAERWSGTDYFDPTGTAQRDLPGGTGQHRAGGVFFAPVSAIGTGSKTFTTTVNFTVANASGSVVGSYQKIALLL